LTPGSVDGVGGLGWPRLCSIDSHFVSTCFDAGPLDELFDHGLDSVQHVLVASVSRGGPRIQHADVKVAVSVVGHGRLGVLRSGSLAWAWRHDALGVLGGDDAVLLEVVDLLDELLTDLLDARADVDGHDPQGLLALLGRVGSALCLGRLDGVVGELADGGGEVGQQLRQLAVDLAECVDVGGGDLAVRLRVLARGGFGRAVRVGFAGCCARRALLLFDGRVGHGGEECFWRATAGTVGCWCEARPYYTETSSRICAG
jgi:hypothetical protein